MESPKFSKDELANLVWAHRQLEHPSLAARLSNYVGAPIEEGFKLLPKTWYENMHSLVETNIAKALKIAVNSIDLDSPAAGGYHLHRILAMGSGAIGGFFGPITLMAELPVMTVLLLRAIADVAREEGEDLMQMDARVACIEVFALGGRSKEDDAAEAGYYGVRTMLGLHFAPSMIMPEAGKAPVIPGGVEIIRAVATRFGTVINDKAAARLVPIAGAVSGAVLNLIFMKHYQDVARGHFIIRHLERSYGSTAVKQAYQNLTRAEIKSEKSYSPLEGW